MKINFCFLDSFRVCGRNDKQKRRVALGPRATTRPPHLLCPRDLGHTPTLSHALHVRIVQMDYDLKTLSPSKFLTKWEGNIEKES